MAVNFPSIDPAQLHPVAGVDARLRRGGHPQAEPQGRARHAARRRRDASRGVFTQNRFCAAPVTVCREHLERVRAGGKPIRALVVNTGNANAGTGRAGPRRTRAKPAPSSRASLDCDAAAGAAVFDRRDPGAAAGRSRRRPACRPRSPIAQAAQLVRRRRGHHDHRHAAEGGVAPGDDRRPHGHADRHQQGRGHDQAEHGDHARLPRDRRRGRAAGARRSWSKHVADRSFNCITIDGDTSTNDSFILIAIGQAGAARDHVDRFARLRRAARRGDRSRADAGAADRARRRRRDQVHDRSRWKAARTSTNAARSPTRSAIRRS